MISVKHLSKRYGKARAVDDVSFDVAPAESVAFWGPNGAGKSTVLRSILGLVSFEGVIEIGGLDVVRRPKATRSMIGHVPQQPAFFDELTVFETAELSARLRRLPAAKALGVLDELGLADDRDKRVGALSGGMRQRLAIAVALVHDPKVLMLDEPTSNLDLESRESVLALFERLRADRCLLLTSHNLQEVGMLVDRVIAMDSGRVRMECEPGALAELLTLRSWMHVIVAPGQASRALDVLTTNGFEARMNSHGVLVEVNAQQKGEALETLHQAGVGLVDIEVWR